MINNELIEDIVQTLVGKPEDVSVSVIEKSKATVLELKVSESDLAQAMGKHGRNVKAISTILNALPDKNKKRVVFEIVR